MYFSGDPRRIKLIENARSFALTTLAPNFAASPLFLAGSTFSDKPYPGDIEMTISVGMSALTPLLMSEIARLRISHDDIKRLHEVDFYVSLDVPGMPNFSEFFQYVGDKTAAIKHLHSKDKRGIIEVSKWIHG